jgi:class 3 adenylate cyclase
MRHLYFWANRPIPLIRRITRPSPGTIDRMEGSGFGGMFGDPDELQRRLGEFAEQMQGAQRLAWADNAIKLAVDLTVAAVNRMNIQGTTEQQAEQLRAVMAVVFPEAVTLVREAREGLA